MSDPLAAVGWPALLVALGVLAAGTYLTYTRFPSHLDTDAAPRGIVSFELPWSAGKARRIVGVWERTGKLDDVRTSLRVDWLFIPLYAATLGVLGLLAARAAGATHVLTADQAQAAASVLVIMAVVAGLLDAVENLGMLAMLGGHYAGGVVPLLTSLVSLVKWVSIGIAASSAMAMLVVSVWRRLL